MSLLVVLREDAPLPVLEIAADLAIAIGLPLADVARALRKSRGVIDLPIPPAAAPAVLALLQRFGRAAAAVPPEVAPAPPTPVVVRRFRFGDEGLLAEGAGPEVYSFARTRIRVLATGSVTFRRPTGSLLPRPAGSEEAEALPPVLGSTSGALLPVGMRPGPRAPRKARRPKEEREEILDLVAEIPDPRLRFFRARLDYRGLPGRPAPSSAENFPRLLRAIAEIAPGARLTSGATAILDGRRTRDSRFENPEAFDAHVRWAAAWPRAFV